MCVLEFRYCTCVQTQIMFLLFKCDESVNPLTKLVLLNVNMYNYNTILYALGICTMLYLFKTALGDNCTTRECDVVLRARYLVIYYFTYMNQ